MPRVLFVAIGSRGDVVPMAALAAELNRRGSEVLVLAHPGYLDIPTAHGVRSASLGAGLVEHVGDQRRAQGWIGNPVLASVALQTWQWRIRKSLSVALTEHVAPGDVVITGVVGVAAALALAEDRDVHVVHVTFSATLPTAGPIAMMAPRTRRPSRLVALWTRHGVWMGSIGLGRPLERAVRSVLNLPWRSPWAVGRAALRTPVLVAASRELVPPQPDWPAGVVVTGAWTQSGSPAAPEGAIVEKLQRQGAPVYIGFGSMLSQDAHTDLRLIDAAATAAGVHVVHRVDDSAPELESTEMVTVVRDLDHRWLFPRCAGIIHHGGAGTTNAALEAGVPSVVVFHGFDQPFHGRRLHELGVGPPPLSRRSLTVQRLVSLLRDMTTGPNSRGYAERAAELGASVRAEDGVGAAADWLGHQRWVPRP